jgi:membrane-associated phospholipid phosphatase
VAGLLRGRCRYLPWIMTALLVCVIGYSRVYLGAHYPADVLGSLLLGSSWLYATLIAIRFVEAPHRFRPAFEECRAFPFSITIPDHP